MKTRTWITPHIPQPTPAGRRSHSAINLNSTLLIFGGYNGKHNSKKNIWIYLKCGWTLQFLLYYKTKWSPALHCFYNFLPFTEHKDDMWQLDLSAEPWSWKRIKPHGNGPEPRRRQALCQVVSIFGRLKICKKNQSITLQEAFWFVS